MAGIGFRLQQLLNSRNYRSLAMAYGYSAVVSSGPWMVSMISLVVIGLLVSTDNALFPGDRANAAAFRVIVTYVYAGSLLLGGLMHLGVARYISDRLYAGEMEEILPCFMRAAGAILLLGVLTAGPWFLVSGLDAPRAVAGFAMFQGLSVVWLCMVFLSAAKGYDFIVWGFIVANALGAALSVAGYRFFGMAGLLWGYAFGQWLLALWLAWRIVREFPSYSPETNDVLQFLGDNRGFVVIGFLFNLGVWIDKFIVWYSPAGLKIIGLFRCAENYDACLFFAYLTVIPAMALFLIRIETAFYRSYSVYFNAVTCGGDLDGIRAGKEKIKQSLLLSASRLAKTQGGLTLCLVLMAPHIAPWLGVGADGVPLLRFSLLAAFLQALLLFLLIFFLYFDWRREGVKLSVTFLAANAGLTLATLAAGPAYLGLGYLFAALLSLVLGIHWFNKGMERLEFETFVKQVGKT